MEGIDNEFDNTIILGTTLWCKTNKTLNNKDVKLISNNICIIFKNKFMPSFKAIQILNNNQFIWLKNTLKKINRKNKQILVITHYLPSKKCIHKKYKNSPYNDLYFTNCENFLQYADYWVAGHTHSPSSLIINNCIINVNPRGDYDEITGYNKKMVINTTLKAHL